MKPNKRGYVNDNWWTAFVRLKDPIPGLKIERIVKHCFFTLHESFRVDNHKRKITPQYIDKNKNKFSKAGEISLSYKGWGYFDLPVEVHFKDELKLDPIKISHLLCFDWGGDWNTYSVNIDEEKLKQFCILQPHVVDKIYGKKDGNKAKSG